MPLPRLTGPLLFSPLFMERIWGGRRLETEFGKQLPPNRKIGEAWEIVDRPEAQSVVAHGPWQGKTLHDLWVEERETVFGRVPETPRFPLLIKLLDAADTLSLQVHPPAKVAKKLGGEPKTEFWYVAKAEPHAQLFVGLRAPTTAEAFRAAITAGTVADEVHAINVKSGDAMFLPAGRFHAIGAGNFLVEVQQNSDSTYRVFDWNRTDDDGKPRTLHIEEALQSIDFTDCQPELVRPTGELLVRHTLFKVERWTVDAPREIVPPRDFAIVCLLEGSVRIGDAQLSRGQFCLVPARFLDERMIVPEGDAALLLRITIPC